MFSSTYLHLSLLFIFHSWKFKIQFNTHLFQKHSSFGPNPHVFHFSETFIEQMVNTALLINYISLTYLVWCVPYPQEYSIRVCVVFKFCAPPKHLLEYCKYYIMDWIFMSPPKFLCWNLAPMQWYLEVGHWEVIRSWEWNLLYKKRSESCLISFCHMKI